MYPRRRSRPHVTQAAPVIPALHSNPCNLLFVWHVLLNAPGSRGNVIDHPMRESTTTRSIRIMHDQHKRFGFWGSVLPRKLRRGIFSVAGVIAGNFTACLKCRAGKLHRSLLRGSDANSSTRKRGSELPEMERRHGR